MNKKWFAALILGGLFTTAGAVAQEKLTRGDKAEKHFETLDTDNDGKLSKAEAEKAPKGKLSENFVQIDTNKDNYLDKAEIKAFMQEKRQSKKTVEKQK